MPLSSVLLCSVAALLAATGQLLFKVGAQGREGVLEFLNPSIAGGLLCYGLGTIVWVYALSFEKLVHVYAFTALTFALVYAGGVLLLGERLSSVGVAGIALILAGLYLLTVHSP